MAITATYTMSACIHGLNFQLWAVILSFGYFAYCEHTIHSKLSERLGQNRTTMATIFNGALSLAFRVLTMINLTYLGAPYDNSIDQETGYNWIHTLQVWKSLYFFFSHFFMSLLLIFSWFL